MDTARGSSFAADQDEGPQRGSGRPIPPLVSKIQVATTNAGARAQGGLTPDFLALSSRGASPANANASSPGASLFDVGGADLFSHPKRLKFSFISTVYPSWMNTRTGMDALNWVNLFIIWVVLGAIVLGLALWICSAGAFFSL